MTVVVAIDIFVLGFGCGLMAVTFGLDTLLNPPATRAGSARRRAARVVRTATRVKR